MGQLKNLIMDTAKRAREYPATEGATDLVNKAVENFVHNDELASSENGTSEDMQLRDVIAGTFISVINRHLDDAKKTSYSAELGEITYLTNQCEKGISVSEDPERMIQVLTDILKDISKAHELDESTVSRELADAKLVIPSGYENNNQSILEAIGLTGQS